VSPSACETCRWFCDTCCPDLDALPAPGECPAHEPREQTAAEEVEK
jgi:hypothetical protein